MNKEVSIKEICTYLDEVYFIDEETTSTNFERIKRKKKYKCK